MCNILLVDMNSFYASVHQAVDASLQGKPVIVCGDPEKRHGIVLAASYEAKEFGVKTTMPKWQAEQLVPTAVFIRPQHSLYAAFSERIMNILRDFSPLVEPSSIDEAYVDVTGCGIFGDSREIAAKIKARIKNEVGVLCSVGIGPNKLLAKMAAEYQKPDGLTIISLADLSAKLWPLPVGELYGVGKRTERKLRLLGIKTIGELANTSANLLEKQFGSMGLVIHASANGISGNRVNPEEHDMKSIGNQVTLSHDYLIHELEPVVVSLAEKVGYRLRSGGYRYKTVSVVLRDTKFANHSWALTVNDYVDTTEEIIRNAINLMKNWPKDQKVRLIGVTVSNLVRRDSEQLTLFSSQEKTSKLDHTCDDIKKKFGYHSIMRGTSLKNNEKDPFSNGKGQ